MDLSAFEKLVRFVSLVIVRDDVASRDTENEDSLYAEYAVPVQFECLERDQLIELPLYATMSPFKFHSETIIVASADRKSVV